MNPPAVTPARLTHLLVLLLGGLLLLGSGCATLSRAKVGISGTNDSERPGR